MLIVSHREELTFEMLVLEPRASDDETLESEASIGTADSSENLNMDSEGTILRYPINEYIRLEIVCFVKKE